MWLESTREPGQWPSGNQMQTSATLFTSLQAVSLSNSKQTLPTSCQPVREYTSFNSNDWLPGGQWLLMYMTVVLANDFTVTAINLEQPLATSRKYFSLATSSCQVVANWCQGLHYYVPVCYILRLLNSWSCRSLQTDRDLVYYSKTGLCSKIYLSTVHRKSVNN